MMTRERIPTRRLITEAIEYVDQGLIVIPVNVLSDGGLLFDSSSEDKLLNNFTGLNYKLSIMYDGNWRYSSSPAVKPYGIMAQIGGHLQQKSTLNSPLFRYLYGLDYQNLREMLGWFRTRPVDALKMYDVLGLSHGATVIIPVLLAILKSKFLFWTYQLDPLLLEKLKYQLASYDINRPETWILTLLSNLENFSLISGTDLTIIKETLELIDSIHLMFPAEFYNIADKYVGNYTTVNLSHSKPQVPDVQTLRILLMDDNVTRGPKFTSTEDITLRDILEEYSNFFKNFRKIVTLLSYDRSQDQAAEVEAVIDKYAPSPMTFEWLVTANSNVIPYFLFHMGIDQDATGHPTAPWRLVKTTDTLINPATVGSLFTRTVTSDYTTDMPKVLQFSYPKTMSLDDAYACIVWGSFITTFITDDLPTDDKITYHFVKKIMDTNLGEWRDESNGSTPLSDLTSNMIYSFFNKIDDNAFEDYWQPRVVDEMDIMDRAIMNPAGQIFSAALPGAGYQSDSMNVLLAKKMNYHNEPIVNIDKWFIVDFWKRFFNPLMSKPDEPKNESKLTAGNYAKSEDAQELGKYKNYLIKMVDFEKGQKHPDRSDSFAVTARKVEDYLQKLMTKPAEVKSDEPGATPTETVKEDE